MQQTAYIVRFVLVLCYSMTIPVLSVYHHHGVTREVTQAVHDPASPLTSSEQHSPYCTICFRVATSPTFQTSCFTLSETFVMITSLLSEAVIVGLPPDPLYLQARAPPVEVLS